MVYVIHQDQVLRMLEEAGRVETGGREELTIGQVFEAYGGRGSGASKRLADELGVSQRQVQRMVTEHGTEKRGMGPKSMRFFREIGVRELRRVGARYYRQNPLEIIEGSSFALCYHRDQQGDDRVIQGSPVVLGDNEGWLNDFEAGELYSMARKFTDEFLSAYGVDAGDLDVCDEDGGSNLDVV